MRHVSIRVTVGLVMLVASATSFAIAAQAAPPAARGAASAQQADPLDLFRPMMPTLTNPRCFNCHGGTDPVTGANHGGGAVGPGADCSACHTAHSTSPDGAPWRDVSGIAFDRQLLPMCQALRRVVQVIGPDQFVDFLGTDEVVGLGFEGLRGMDENSPAWPIEAAPPPMAREDFVAAAQQWVTDGNFECTKAGWTGTIVQVTSLRSGTAPNEITRDLTVTVNVDHDVATATVHMVGKTIQEGQTVNGCQTYNHETFAVDVNVPAQVQIAVSPPILSDAAGALPPLPPGVPDPRAGIVTLSFGVGQTVRGVHHIETQFVTNPPKFTCEKSVQDPPYQFAPTTLAIIKGLEGGDTKHLVGSDEQITEGSTVKTTWELQMD